MKKFSEINKIEDKSFALVINYIKEHVISDIIRVSHNNNFLDMFTYDNWLYSIWLTIDEKISIYNNDNYATIIELNKVIFAENIDWLFNSIERFTVERNIMS